MATTKETPVTTTDVTTTEPESNAMPDPTEKRFDTHKRLAISSSLLEKLNSTGNASEYLRDAARDRMRRAQEAQMLLSTEGWEANELRAVFDAIRPKDLSYGVDFGSQIAHEMEAAAYYRSVDEKWDISPERWEELKEMVREEESVARAVRDLATEYWGPSEHLNL